MMYQIKTAVICLKKKKNQAHDGYKILKIKKKQSAKYMHVAM